jgi:hypothetical protein
LHSETEKRFNFILYKNRKNLHELKRNMATSSIKSTFDKFLQNNIFKTDKLVLPDISSPNQPKSNQYSLKSGQI